MVDAKKLLLDLLAVIPDGVRNPPPFFAEDPVMELPFLQAIGIPTRYQGHAASAAARALNPSSVADLPPPGSEIFSVPPDDPKRVR